MASKKLTREDLYTLETYSEIRAQFRAQMIDHKRNRRVEVGPYAILHFEDWQTMRYQVQEMLRSERLFEAGEIEDELAAYNPLVPDGSNWKATFMLEYEDPAERAIELAKLIGVEERVWVRVGASRRIFAIADEDLQRENAQKTSAVHFLRFELPAEEVQAAKQGAPISIGIDHPGYSYHLSGIAENVRTSLVSDLD